MTEKKMTRAEEAVLRDQFMTELTEKFDEFYESGTGQIEIPFGDRVFGLKATLRNPDFDVDEAAENFRFEQETKEAEKQAKIAAKAQSEQRKAEAKAKREAAKAGA